MTTNKNQTALARIPHYQSPATRRSASPLSLAEQRVALEARKELAAIWQQHAVTVAGIRAADSINYESERAYADAVEDIYGILAEPRDPGAQKFIELHAVRTMERMSQQTYAIAEAGIRRIGEIVEHGVYYETEYVETGIFRKQLRER